MRSSPVNPDQDPVFDPTSLDVPAQVPGLQPGSGENACVNLYFLSGRSFRAWSTRHCKSFKHDMPEQIARRDRAKDRDALTQTRHGLRHHGREPGLLDLVGESIALATSWPDRRIGAAFLDAFSS